MLGTIETLRPDAVLMGFRWPDERAVAVCREIRERVPATRVLLLSYQNWEEEMLISVLAGTSGYISQSAEGSELVRAISIAVNGGVYFDWEVVRQVTDRLRKPTDSGSAAAIPGVLSHREVIILRMVGEGYDNREIGQRLNIATTTARNNVTKILRKLGMKSRARLVSFAARRGILVSAEDPVGDPLD